MTQVKIYHNPRCTKSRQTLALLREHGVEPQIIEYLKTPPNERDLTRLAIKLDLDPEDMVRKKDARALGLIDIEDPKKWILAMAQYPQIIERPIVCIGKRARIGRPPEQVLDLLQ